MTVVSGITTLRHKYEIQSVVIIFVKIAYFYLQTIG